MKQLKECVKAGGRHNMKTCITANGQSIAEIRSARLMTMEQFAEFCGVSRHSMYRAETGERISAKTAGKIAAALERPAEELFTIKVI